MLAGLLTQRISVTAELVTASGSLPAGGKKTVVLSTGPGALT